VACSKEVANSLEKLTFATYSANPLAMAAGREVLKVVDEEGMQQNSLDRGNQFLKGLRELQSQYKQIGDVRGSGLMIGVELVQDPESKAPVDPAFFADVFEKTKDYGILLGKGGRFGNTFRIQPPMCISEQDVDFALDVLDQSFKEATQAKR
jgi:alanine-glyoxylate transaminase/(R)-3-amino-2-methylpropionate-pyruvate transaminase